MDLKQYLKRYACEVPAWLARVNAQTRHFPRKAFLRSNVVFCPGAEMDGQPVEVFGSTHVAHCFVYVDHAIGIAPNGSELAHPTCDFKGYESLLRLPLDQDNITDHDWPLFGDAYIESGVPALAKRANVGLFEILLRRPEYDASHGPERLAIIFLRADPFAAYEALYLRANDDVPRTGDIVFPPIAVVVNDRGLWKRQRTLGRGGQLERMAVDEFFSPRWLLVAQNSDAWSGYERVSAVEASPGSAYGHVRHLFERVDAPCQVAERATEPGELDESLLQ